MVLPVPLHGTERGLWPLAPQPVAVARPLDHPVDTDRSVRAGMDLSAQILADGRGRQTLGRQATVDWLKTNSHRGSESQGARAYRQAASWDLAVDENLGLYLDVYA